MLGARSRSVGRHLTRQPEPLPKFQRGIQANWNAYLLSFDDYPLLIMGRREFWPGVRPLRQLGKPSRRRGLAHHCGEPDLFVRIRSGQNLQELELRL